MAKTPLQSYVRGGGGPSSLTSGKQACILASEEIFVTLCDFTLATDFIHPGGIGWEGGIDSNKSLAYFILMPRARARGIQREGMVWTKCFLMEMM